MATYIRKQLAFNTDNPEEMRAIEVLDKFKKSQTTITILALNEFMDKYGLYDKSSDELKKFLMVYPFLKSCLKNNLSQPVLPPSFGDCTLLPSAPKVDVEPVGSTNSIPDIVDPGKTPMDSTFTSSSSSLPDEVPEQGSMDVEVSSDSKEAMKDVLSMFLNH